MPRNSNHLRVPVAFLVVILSQLPSVHSQWIVYNFSPRAAFQSSTVYSTNSGSSGSVGGWPASWNDSSAVGVIALLFTTNTNGPNVVTALDPIVYTRSSSTALLSTNNYDSSVVSLLGLTNTNTNAFGTNTWFFSRSSNGPVMGGQYILAFSNTNTVGTFLARLSNYSTNTIGTNGVNASLTRFPPLINLRVSSMDNLTNPSAAVNRQLTLALSINPTLTKTVNTNTNFTTSLTNSAVIRSNLPRLIRSNSTYTNTP